jgi:hypothetical protein
MVNENEMLLGEITDGTHEMVLVLTFADLDTDITVLPTVDRTRIVVAAQINTHTFPEEAFVCDEAYQDAVEALFDRAVQEGLFYFAMLAA